MSQDATQKVHEAFRIAEDAQAEDFERYRKLLKAYKATPDSSSYTIATRAQYVVPIIYKTVETVLPRIISVIFSASPPVQSRWRIAPPLDDTHDKLRNLDQMFEKTYDDKHLFWVVQGWFKESLIFGQSYVKVGWKHKIRNFTKTVQVPNLETGQIEDKEESGSEVVEDGVDVQNVDIFDLFFSPEAHFPHPFGSGKYVIHRIRKRRSKIMAMKEAGIYGPMGGGEDFTEDQLPQSMDSDAKAAVLQKVPFAQNDGDPMVTMYEYWEDDRVITTADHSVLLRDEVNPFGLPGRPKMKPFVAACDNLMVGVLPQIGEAEPLEHTQIEISTLRRQRTDNNSLIINSGIVYDKDSEFDLESWKLSRPRMAVGVRAQNGSIANSIMPLPQGEINGASYKESQDLDKDAQEISGLLDYAVGASPERKETATTVQLLQTAANLRFDIKIRNYNQSFLELNYMMMERWCQFLTKPVSLRIPIQGSVQPTFKQITRIDLPMPDDVDLVAPGSPGLLLKDARQQKILQQYQSLVANPLFAQSPNMQQAALLLYIQGLKESEIDGIEPIVELLKQSVVPPLMPQMPGQNPALAGASAPQGFQTPTPPMGPSPMRPEGGAQVNERPLVLPFPRPSR